VQMRQSRTGDSKRVPGAALGLSEAKAEGRILQEAYRFFFKNKKKPRLPHWAAKPGARLLDPAPGVADRDAPGGLRRGDVVVWP